MRHRLEPRALARACIAAGPTFVAAWAVLAQVDAAGSAPLAISARELAMVAGGIVGALVPVVVIGALLAFLPVLVGASVMTWLSNRIDEAAGLGAWLATGAAAATPAALLGGSEAAPLVLALAATGATCAGLCWRGLTAPPALTVSGERRADRPAGCWQGSPP